MTIQESSPAALARRAHIEALLAAYPAISTEEHGVLVNYFRREANALDIGMLASNPAIASGYARFRSEHIDRFTVKDAMKGLAGAAALVLCVGLIMFRAL